MSDWKPPPYWTAEELEHWKSLDHTMCTGFFNPMGPQLEPYEWCMSSHCPNCGQRTGGGHLAEQGEWTCPIPEDQRKPWPQPEREK